MKKVYRADIKNIAGLAFIVLFLIAGPPVIIRSQEYTLSGTETLIILSVFYAAFSPVIYILLKLALWNFLARITVSAAGINFRYGNIRGDLTWKDITSLHYDYLETSSPRYSPSYYYIVYEGGNKDLKFRFNTRISRDKIPPEHSPNTVSPFREKAYRLQTYGLYLSPEKTVGLARTISDYTSIKPERKDLFS